MIRTSMLALAIALSAGATRADDLSDLVDRYVAWRGGPAFEQLQTIHERVKVEASGLHGTGDIWTGRDGRQRNDVDLVAFKQTQVITPDLDQSWETNVGGQVEAMPKRVSEFLHRALALQFADALRGRGGATATLLGVEQRDGQSWSVVRLSFGDADTYDAFIDSATGALDGFRVTEDHQTHFERLSDWRLVDGVRMPFDDKITTDTPGGDQTMQVDTVELNKTLPDVGLARPGSVHKAMFSGGASSTGWIPFELSGGHIYFPVKVNGHDVVVMIDSGAEVSVMDKTLAGSMGLETKGETAVQGSSGDQAAGLVSGVTVEVGNLKLSGLTVISTDLKSLEPFVGHSLPFILGDDLFNEVAVDIDFANKRIAFRDPAHLARPEGAAEVPLNKLQALRSIPVSFEGGPTVDVHFDLGNGGSVMVYPAYAKAHGLPGARRTSQRLSGGAGGALPETTAILRKLQFAGVTFTDVPAIFPPDTIASVNSGALAGNVGLPIFSRFHMVIDFSHDRLWMTPAADAATAPFAKDRLGLFLAPKDGALQVVFVSPGSPAEKAGLKAGDRIRLIDHKASAAWSTDALAKLGAGAAATRVELTMADGKVRRLTLKDYF